MAMYDQPPYYLSAYGLAVKHGFEGTEEEWVASLKGEKGDGLYVLGSFDSLAALEEAYPDGQTGGWFRVGAEPDTLLYYWDAQSASWLSLDLHGQDGVTPTISASRISDDPSGRTGYRVTISTGRQVVSFPIYDGEAGVSAYYLAALGGYTGTEREFAEDLASFVDRATAAAGSATRAVQSAEAAAGSASDAREHAENAGIYASNAGGSATQAAGSAAQAEAARQAVMSQGVVAQVAVSDGVMTVTYGDGTIVRYPIADSESLGFTSWGFADGYLHLYDENGEDALEPLYIGTGGGSGGGGGNSAVLTVTNTTGWLAKTISAGASCPLTLTWSSLENQVPTGNGTLTVSVNGAARLTRDAAQGAVSVDVGPYLSAGANQVRVKLSDVYENTKTLAFTITAVELTLSSSFDDAAVFGAGSAVAYTYTPTGAVEKTVRFVVDGVQTGTAAITTSGRQQTYMLPAMSHGAHSLRVWFTAEIDGETVASNELYYELIVADPDSDAPIIASPFRADTAAQYETLTIPYRVYTPSSLTSDVTLSAGGAQTAALTVDRRWQTWSYRPDAAGTLTLGIASGSASRTFTLAVTASAIDVEAETDSLALHLSSYGRSNSETNPGAWTYGNVAAEFSGFNFSSDGWVTDGDGVTALRVAGDARVTIPYQIFAGDFRSTGKTIELEFATRDVTDYDAVILSCLSGGRGLTVTAQRATLTSEQSELGMQYKEDEHVRLAFVVEKRSEHRLMYVYVNGIMSGAAQYPDGDDFAQPSPVGISIGSGGCAVDLYRIRVYDNDLTRYQVLDNWIADTQDITAMLARYERNDVYDAYGDIVIAKLPEGLPYMVIECGELPQYKGDKKTVGVTYVDPVTPENSFTASNVQADVQGTSSQYYARKNYKLKYQNGFDMTQSGTHAAAYALREGAVATDAFCMKADVASSEGANNVELARLYNDVCPYKTPPQEENGAVRQGIDGFPCVIFWSDGERTTFLGKYNFNNDKGTEEVFGFSPGDESWEIKNNTSSRVLWKSADYSGTAWLDDFEARYPDGNEDPTNLKALSEWLASTDQSAVSSAEEKAARLQKFRDELPQYMEKDAVVFYYLFTELFLMVDSRAKNAFPTAYLTGGGKWFSLPYDFDTALGINNEGALAFSYNLEDIDTTAGGADVFNGQQSVLWINLRQAFQDDIKSMYQTLRSTGALSYAKVEEMFETHQAKWGEAIFNEDAYFKYLAPLVDDGSGAYLAMLQGSKAEQRKWWLYNRFRYIDSKYNAGDALSDVIQLRGYAKADITVTPYADVYPSVKYGSYLVQARGARGQSCTLACPLDSVNDTEIYIYSASQLASVGDLSGLKIGFADFSMATRLQSIKVGDGAEGYENGNLTELHLGNNTLLRSLDARGCTALTGAVDLSGCGSIEHVYLGGTAVTGVALPNGGILKTLSLPDTITSLVLQNQPALTTLAVENDDYSHLTTLRLENIGAAVDSRAMVGELGTAARVRLIGFSWTFETSAAAAALLDTLADMRGLDENGGNTERAQLAGSITVASATSGQIAGIRAQLAANGWTDVTVDCMEVITYLTAALSAARSSAAGAHVGNYALCMGGYGSSYSTVVDAYDASLTRTTPEALSAARSDSAAASGVNHALCMGGYASTDARSAVVDAYDTSLTRTVPTALGNNIVYAAGASVGNYALCMGGYPRAGNVSALATVYAYDASLARTTATALSAARRKATGASVGNYALYMGGDNGSSRCSTVVDAYDTSLTRTTATALSVARQNAVGASVGNYALCMGGDTGSSSYSTVVDAYDASLTRTTPEALSVARSGSAAASGVNHAWCMGGDNGSSRFAVAETYDASLTRTVRQSLPSARSGAAGASVGNYALCMGGYSGSSRLDSVIAYVD